MRHASAGDDQATGDDITADAGAEQAAEQSAEEGVLEVEEYSLPQSIEKKTPIGSKLVFEKWVDKAGKEFVAVNIVYQTTEQLRNVSLLNLENPPVVFSLKLKGLQANADGLYTIESVNDRFDKAIRAYEAIK